MASLLDSELIWAGISGEGEPQALENWGGGLSVDLYKKRFAFVLAWPLCPAGGHRRKQGMEGGGQS